MKTISIKDKKFGLAIPEVDLLKAIDVIAEKMNRDLADKNPIFLIVLNGAFMFAADLLKRVNVLGEVTCIKLASYCGTSSTGEVSEVIGLNEDIEGRTVVIIEDIIDSGLTMNSLTMLLREKKAADIKIATLFFKPDSMRYDVRIDYAALEIANDFIIGHGLDYDGYARNLRDIYKLIP